MKKAIIFTLLCLFSLNLFAQNRRSAGSYYYTHKLKPIIVSESKNKFSSNVVISPYKNLVDVNTTNNYLTASGYNTNSEKALYFIEFQTSEVTPVLESDGSVKVNSMIMYYNYTTNVKVTDQSGKIVSERNLTLPNEINALIIENPLLVGDVKKGNKEVISGFVNKNLPFIYKGSLSNAKEYLNVIFCGKSNTDTLYVYSGKGKTFDYTELESTAELFKSTLSVYMTKKADTAQTISVVKKSIEVWEKELATADFANSEARISKEIALGLCYNLATGYFLLQDYAKASEFISKTYRKEEDNSGKLMVRGDFEVRALKLEKIILTYSMR